jgi:hypothetical protein
MPTAKPRIQVTLTEHQYEVIRALTSASGQSMSAFLSEIVELSMPTFERMAATFQKLKDVQRFEAEKLAKGLHEANAALEPVAERAVREFSKFLDTVEAAAEPPSRSSARKAGSVAASREGGTAKSPRPVTRGLRRSTERGGVKVDTPSDKARRQVVRKGGA